MATPRQRRRGHEPTNSPFEALPRLPSLGGHGNGALLPDAMPGRQYLSPGHGHPLCADLSLLQVLLHPLPLCKALHRLFDPVFRHRHFRLQGRPQDSGRHTTSLSCPRKRTGLSLVVGEVHHPRKQMPSETPRWLVTPERGLFTGIAIVGAVGSGKTASWMYAFAEQIKCRAAEGSATGAATPPLASRAEGKLAS